MSVSTLRPSCLTVTHSLWRVDLAMRSRAQDCDHSCAAEVCAVKKTASDARRIIAKRFIGLPQLRLRQGYYFVEPNGRKRFRPRYYRLSRLTHLQIILGHRTYNPRNRVRVLPGPHDPNRIRRPELSRPRY